MKKIARADVMQYGIPPKHFGVNSARLQGKDESGLLDSRTSAPTRAGRSSTAAFRS